MKVLRCCVPVAWLLMAVQMIGCRGEQELEFTVVGPMPVDELIAQLPYGWNRKTPQFSAHVNGYVYLSDLLNADPDVIPWARAFDRNLPDDEAREMIATIEPWFEEFEIALAMEEWQVPLPDKGYSTLFPELASMKSILFALTVASRLAMEDGRTGEAVRLLLLLDRFADRQIWAGGSVIHYLMGLAMDAVSARAINEAVLTGKLSVSQLELLLDASGDPGLNYGLQVALLDEVHGQAAHEIARMAFPETINAAQWGGDPSDDRFQDWERVMKEIFIGHENPLDKIESLVIITEVLDELLRSLVLSFDPVPSAEKLLDKRTKLWDARELVDLLAFGEWSEDEIDEARTRISSKANPYGQLWVRMLATDTTSLKLVFFVARTRREMMQCCIGIRLYEAKFNKLPQAMGELVESGVLRAAPKDYFSGGALRIDYERRVIWSVGADMVDDNGEGEYFKPEPDLVIPF